MLISQHLTARYNEPYLYPDLKKVAILFAQNFELDDFRSNDFYRFNFIRKPSGWYVLPVYLSENKEKQIMIWSAEKGYPSYINPDTTNNKILITELISNRDLYDYAIHPFYGYRNWMDDVINHYEKEDISSISDNELYGLGRAYAQKASDIFWSHSQYSDPSDAKGISAGRKEAQLYMNYAVKGIEYFHKLYTRSPEYSTLIGLMDIKYANEVMNSFYELQIFGFQKEAESLLEKTQNQQLYEVFWEKYAYEILSSLEYDGIIFTNGDNDTYPLIWMQQIKHFRQDITVINLSLLSDPLYYYLITRDLKDKKNLRSNLSKNQILSLYDRTILIDDKEPQMLSFDLTETFLSQRLEENNTVISLPFGFYNINYLTSEGLIDTLTLSSGIRGNVQSNAEFLIRSIINSHIGKRPLYFSKGMQPRFKSMVDKKHLVDKGLFYSLEKKNHNSIQFENQYFDTSSIHQLINNSGIPAPNSDYFSRTIIHNLILEARIIQIYNAEYEGDYDKKYNLILEFIENFSPDKTGINYYYLFLIDNLYKNEKFVKFSQQSFRLYFYVLKDSILKTILEDDNPRDIDALKYYRTILSLVKMSAFAENDNDLDTDISFLEKTIEKRLLEFPEISID